MKSKILLFDTGIGSRIRVGRPRNRGSSPFRDKSPFLFIGVSKPAPWSTQASIQMVPELFLWVV
jgi:hypothetical protein